MKNFVNLKEVIKREEIRSQENGLANGKKNMKAKTIP